jgi:hypothetical protein
MTLESFQALQAERIRRLPSSGGCHIGDERSYNRSLHTLLDEMIDLTDGWDQIAVWNKTHPTLSATEHRKRLKKWWWKEYHD